jgi:ATP-binding cassette subfamily F protein uup
MVTHDRYFLEGVTNRIIELDNGKLYSYQANFSKYLEMKAERMELVEAGERKRQSLLRKELDWIKRGAKARSTKQKARIERFEKLSEVEAPGAEDKLEIKIEAPRLGRKIIEIDNIQKEKLIKDFSYKVQSTDRIGILGPNGIGKTTLLRMINGQIEPDEGSIEVGETVKIGLFSQENDEMDHSLRVIDYIREGAEYIKTSEGSISASKMLETFLFPAGMAWTPISKLSGGEKRRLYLLRILMESPNVLMLDEPTNDLDITTLSILEDYIERYSGVVITVSHDRYFLDKVTNKIFTFEGNGIIKQHIGNYSDYADRVKNDAPELKPSLQSSNTTKDNKVESVVLDSDNYDESKKQVKFTFKEQREYEQIDSLIESLECSLNDLNVDIESSSSDFMRLQGLIDKRTEVEASLEQAIERWAYLTDIAERMKT